MSRLVLFLALTGGLVPLSAAPACISGGNLAGYMALGSGGCTIGELLVKDFSFGVGPSGGGATPITAGDVTVTPTFGADLLGIQFSSAGFSVTGGQFVNYTIGYTWDPSGDIRGMGDVLDPGTTDILTNGCVGVAFSGTSCSGTPVSVHVFQGVTSQLTDAVFFPDTAILGVLNNISLQANGGAASIDHFIENDAYVPEPGSAGLLGLGLAMFWGGLMRTARRPCSSRYRRTGQSAAGYSPPYKSLF